MWKFYLKILFYSSGLSLLAYLNLADFTVLGIVKGNSMYLWNFFDPFMSFLVVSAGTLFSLIFSFIVFRILSSRPDNDLSRPEIMAKIVIVFRPFCLGYIALLQVIPWLIELNEFTLIVSRSLSLVSGCFMLFVFVVSVARLLFPGVGFGLLVLAVRAREKARNHPRIVVISIFAVSLLIYSLVLPKLPGLNGDEPHYLLIVQSLIKDGDLDVNNNYINRDYNEYIPGILDRHVTIGRQGIRYSTHPVGLAYLLAPAYYAGGYPFVLRFLNILAALLSVQLFLLCRQLLHH